MQFSVLIVAAFAAVAIATPMKDECDEKKSKGGKGEKPEPTETEGGNGGNGGNGGSATMTSSAAQATSSMTPAQQAQQKCGNNQKLSCCDSVQKQTLNGIPIQVGINCVTINLLSLVPVTSQCSTQVACCQSGSQTGLVNVGNICPIIL